MTRRVSIPMASIASSFRRSVWMRRGARAGRSTAIGCGSNVIANEGRPIALARSTTVSRIRRCPRWTPSKLPIVPTPPRGRSVWRRGSRMTCMGSCQLSADDATRHVVIERLFDPDRNDGSGCEVPAAGVGDQDTSVDVGRLRAHPALEEILVLLRGAFHDRLDRSAAQRAQLLSRDGLLQRQEKVLSPLLLLGRDGVPEGLGARAGL